MNSPSKWLLLLISLVCGQCFAADTLWDRKIDTGHEPGALLKITDRLGAVETLRSDFVQTRTMSFLKKPLVVKGDFIYSKDRGLVWRLSSPLESVYVITPDSVYRYGDDSRDAGPAASGDRVFRQTAAMFSSIFTADISALSKLFEIYFLAEEGGWQIGLVPKRKMIGKMIEHIRISGDRFVDSVLITEASQDSVTIEFGGMQTTPAGLTPDELIYFDKE